MEPKIKLSQDFSVRLLTYKDLRKETKGNEREKGREKKGQIFCKLTLLFHFQVT